MNVLVPDPEHRTYRAPSISPRAYTNPRSDGSHSLVADNASLTVAGTIEDLDRALTQMLAEDVPHARISRAGQHANGFRVGYRYEPWQLDIREDAGRSTKFQMVYAADYHGIPLHIDRLTGFREFLKLLRERCNETQGG